MKSAAIFPAALAFLLAACDSPKTRFERAVLNCNFMHGFADDGMLRQLESPSAKLTNVATGASAPMKRTEVVADKIAFLEQSLEKVRKLSLSGDSKDMIQASIALYELVLPVFKNEYQQLAKLYDDGAPRSDIDALAATIHTKYSAPFHAQFDKLTALAKPYAAKHDIKVIWDVKTSPR